MSQEPSVIEFEGNSETSLRKVKKKRAKFYSGQGFEKRSSENIWMGISLDNQKFYSRSNMKAIVHLLNQSMDCFDTCYIFIADFLYQFYYGDEVAKIQSDEIRLILKELESDMEFPFKIISWNEFVEIHAELYVKELENHKNRLVESKTYRNIVDKFYQDWAVPRKYSEKDFLNYLLHDVASVCCIKEHMIYPSKELSPVFQYLRENGLGGWKYHGVHIVSY